LELIINKQQEQINDLKRLNEDEQDEIEVEEVVEGRTEHAFGWFDHRNLERFEPAMLNEACDPTNFIEESDQEGSLFDEGSDNSKRPSLGVSDEDG
jgi:hypothetical protein